MSNQDTESVAVTPQYSPSINNESKKDDPNPLVKCVDNNYKNTEFSQNKIDDHLLDDKNDHQIVRNESVIQSPSKSSPTTPLIQIVDTSNQNVVSNDDNDNTNNNNNETTLKRSQESCQTVNTQTTSLSSNVNFLQPFSNISPNNPFLRATSFYMNSVSTCSDSHETNSENQIVFTPPKLIPTSSFSNKFETSLQSSFLKTSDSNMKKPSETISASKTFISLNKEDIGKIKTPAFIKNTSLTLSNGNSENKDGKNQSNNDDKTTFLFGQKLEDRVVVDSFSQLNDDLKTDSTKSDHRISFSDVTKAEETPLNSIGDHIVDDTKTERSSSLSVKSGKNDGFFKRKYEVITGEEDEQNVLTIYGKLYAWDTEKASWVEKGRGHLRLNDVMKNEKLCSRLIMRTAGALRLILNAHIVVGMIFELASENCLRFTYVDGIYMIKANPKDIDQLYSAIEHRLRELSKKLKITNTNENDKKEEE